MTMRRRQLLRYAQGGLIASLGMGLVDRWYTPKADAAQSLTIQFLGHTCFLMSGSGVRVLVNPFRPTGCTAKMPAPKVGADLVLISSRQLDEGVVEGLPGRPKLLFDPGPYQTNGLQFQGIRTLHDRQNGYRFGTNTVWKWKQGGLNLVHLGGIASPLNIEQKILLGTPDVLFIPVGGTDETYTPEEAKGAIALLQPRLVIPTHYKTGAADPALCELQPVDNFLKVMAGTSIRRGKVTTLSLSPGSLPKGPVIQVMG
ncbi:MBL fold metallo-hydrolase [Altericista sp. CCNU0014]|uniref:MBL fold metallo-hydrolase n=1 Tax=Altericista sp. CCNU0014 TaxID=3082949 RepID=UPI003850581D